MAIPSLSPSPPHAKGADAGYRSPPQPGFDFAFDEAWVAQVNHVKRKIRSELHLPDWQKYGFGHKRAAEFEQLAASGDDPPGALARETAAMSLEDFWEKYEKPGRPCLISGIPEFQQWPACEKWTFDGFFKKFRHSHFKVGKDDDGSTIRLRADFFEEYMKTQKDDSPVYLFDNHFKHEKEELLSDYRIPHYFPDDFMALADEDRPPYRWIGIGPKRSGTVMHQDPLCTSAWNTLIRGRKLWLLLPPSTPKRVAKSKDVMLPDDDDEACNHFLDLLPRKRARQDPDFHPLLCVQYPGETIFVPGNWWHCVLNLDDTIAVTQNYVGRHNFASVWRSCREERPCWSYRWLRNMEALAPELAAEARRLNLQDGFDMEARRQLNRRRLLEQRERRTQRALKAAKRRAAKKGIAFDDEVWLTERRNGQEDVNSDSTVSTSSSDSDSSQSSDSSAAP